MAVPLLIVATTLLSAQAKESEVTEPPLRLASSLELALEPTPQLAMPIEVAKSRHDEQIEYENAEKAARAAKIRAENQRKRMQSTSLAQNAQNGRSVQEQGNYVHIIGQSSLQCVVFARQKTGNAKIRGYAGNLVAEGNEPRVGAIALESRYGHASVIVAVEGEWIIVQEANWKKGYLTERRVHVSTQRGYIY